jgi:hypothetical protein
LGEGEYICFDETAIFQAAHVCPVFGAGKQSLRKIDAGYLNVGVALRQAAGVEAGATGDLQQMGFRTRPGAGPEGLGNGGGVIAEQMLTTECVKP